MAAPSATTPETALAASVEHDLGWALGTLLRSYQRNAAGALGGLPGGPRGYLVLSAAAHELPCTQQALGQRVGVDRSVMTYLVDDLVSAGLVERRPDPVDRRVRRVVLTDAGQERLAALEGDLDAVGDHVLRSLSDEERVALRRLVRQAAVTVDEAHPGTACENATAAD